MNDTSLKNCLDSLGDEFIEKLLESTNKKKGGELNFKTAKKL